MRYTVEPKKELSSVENIKFLCTEQMKTKTKIQETEGQHPHKCRKKTRKILYSGVVPFLLLPFENEEQEQKQEQELHTSSLPR